MLFVTFIQTMILCNISLNQLSSDDLFFLSMYLLKAKVVQLQPTFNDISLQGKVVENNLLHSNIDLTYVDKLKVFQFLFYKGVTFQQSMTKREMTPIASVCVNKGCFSFIMLIC